MVCYLFVLGGDANTGSAGYVCLETELMGGESDFHAAMLAAFAVAALLGLPSFFAAVSPGAATPFLGGENVFNAALPAAFAFAALLDRPSCFAVARLYSLCFQGVCSAMLRFQRFFVVLGCLLRCCFGLRFKMATVGMLAALSTLWSFCLGLRC